VNPQALAEILTARSGEIPKHRVVTGFDGFVDEMISLVAERKSLERFARVEHIDQFGDLVKAAAGHSSLREIVVTQTDPGGCAVNMGDGLATLGAAVTTFATVGQPVHAAFDAYSRIATLHSWGREPGRTLAFEFADGKLMFSSVSHLAEFTPDYVKQRLAEQDFEKSCRAADLIAFVDWTLYPHMTACWQLLAEQVFAKLEHRPFLFLDLVDPSSRSRADIEAMLEGLPLLNRHCRTTLGLNQNEANILSDILSQPHEKRPEMDGAAGQAKALQGALGIDEVVIHATRFAVLANEDGTAQAPGPYCEKPVKSTGAGDRFNAGYALGLVLHLPPEDRLLLGNATSGAYVRSGTSPSISEVIQLLQNYPQR